MKKTPPTEKPKSNAGRNTKFKNNQPAIPKWTSFPADKYDELCEQLEELRNPYLNEESLQQIFKKAKEQKLSDREIKELLKK